MALLYLDMDHFKEVNDTFGHASGDRVLEALTERLTRVLSSESVLGRLAGDEFALFVDGLSTDAQETSEQVSQLRPHRARHGRRRPSTSTSRKCS